MSSDKQDATVQNWKERAMQLEKGELIFVLQTYLSLYPLFYVYNYDNYFWISLCICRLNIAFQILHFFKHFYDFEYAIYMVVILTCHTNMTNRIVFIDGRI